MIPALAIGTAWVIVACAIAPKIGRALKHADPGEDASPPTPELDPTWIDSVSVDALADCDQLLHDRFDAIVIGDWFDGAIHYTGHLHGDAA